MKTSHKISLILMDPYIIDYSVEIPATCSFVIEFIIPKFFKGSTCPYGDRPLPRLSGHSSAHSALATASHHMGI
jgi:hypothetical protein